MKLTGQVEIKKFKALQKRSVCEVAFDLILDDGSVCDCKATLNNPPTETLLNTLDKLLPDVISSQGLDEHCWAKTGCVTGLTLKADGKQYRIVLTVQQQDGSSAPINSKLMEADEVDQSLVERVVKEIERYLGGDVASTQASLFPPGVNTITVPMEVRANG